MTDTPATKRKPADKVPSEFAGMTVKDCCHGCRADYCVISGVGICAHPMKGGLPSAMMNQPDAVKRDERAKRAMRSATFDLTK